MILYGFCDVANNDSRYILSIEYLESNYGLLHMKPMDVIKNYGSEYVFGIDAYITDDGVAKYTCEDAFKQLMEFKQKYEKYHSVEVSLQFHTVICGDYNDSKCIEYDLDDGEGDLECDHNEEEDSSSVSSTHLSN